MSKKKQFFANKKQEVVNQCLERRHPKNVLNKIPMTLQTWNFLVRSVWGKGKKIRKLFQRISIRELFSTYKSSGIYLAKEIICVTYNIMLSSISKIFEKRLVRLGLPENLHKSNDGLSLCKDNFRFITCSTFLPAPMLNIFCKNI